MENKEKNNSNLVLVISIIGIIICAVFIGAKIYQGYKNDHAYDDLQSKVEKETTQVEETTEETIKDNPVNFEELYQTNKDIIGWLVIEDTKIDYPVLQYPEENQAYYLYRNVYGEKSIYGSIYTERKNSKDFTDRVTVMYGHNMNNGSMFNNLHKFSDKEFFDKHQYIYLFIPGHILKYEVVSAFEYDDRHILNSFDFADDKTFEGYLEMIQNPQSMVKNVRDGIELTLDDKILVLSTCVNTNESARYLVQARLAGDEITK